MGTILFLRKRGINKMIRIQKHIQVLVILLVLVCTSISTLANTKESNLIKAAGDGNLRQVQALIAAKADVNAKDNDGATALIARPDDFSLRYEWREGSIPPPYHYEYSISIKPDGRGQVVMVPDYHSDQVPIWTETFRLQPTELDALYASLTEQGLFRQVWQAPHRLPVGSSSQTLVIVAQGKSIVLPDYVVPEQAPAAKAIYATVIELVPKSIWTELYARRAEYVKEHRKRW
jgi:hypothetical protein